MPATSGAGESAQRVPRLAPDWSPDDRDLSPAEGFLLSRIDGRTPWAQLRHIGGLPPEEVDRCLERWVAEGLLLMAGGELTSPGEDSNGLPEGRAAGPDESLLDAALDLSEQQQRHILAFEACLDLPYHDVLGVARDADAREIKRAYFRLSKEFHPDRYYRSQIGHFAERLDRIFKRVVEAYELLSDPATRAEIERSYAQMPPPARPAPAADEAAAAPQPEVAAEETRRAHKRETLERLRRRFRIPDAILQERRTKARGFSESARVAIHRGNWMEAAASARLAIAFDPWNDEHRRTFGDIQSRVHELRAAELLEQADVSWDAKAQQEALRLYEEALAYRPNDAAINVRAAALCADLGRLEQAREYAETACEVQPEEAAHHVALGRVLRLMGVRDKAQRALERALELDGDNADAKKEVMALRRGSRVRGGGAR